MGAVGRRRGGSACGGAGAGSAGGGGDNGYGPTENTTFTSCYAIPRGVAPDRALPLGRPVVLHLTARDVIHSFTLNEMRVKQDATPGLVVRTWFTPTVPGKWEIACSQLCGLGHYRMRGDYTVMPEEEWNRWLASEVALISPAKR